MKRHELIAADSVPIPRVEWLGFSDDPKITRFGPSIRNQYIIHYVLSGKGVFNGHTVGKGEGFLIYPRTSEEYHADEQDPWSFIWVVTGDSAMRHFMDAHPAEKRTGIFRFHLAHEIYELETLLRATMQKPTSSAELTERFLRIFHACVTKDTPLKQSAAKTYFEFSVNYINANIGLPLSVSQICEIIGITQPYLYKIFKEELGIAPKHYISERKMAQAKELLEKTDLSVSDVARTVGFENVLDFSKFFAKHAHVSPTAYKKISQS